ncbi:MAG: NPCBM/NEW2 domain-containing protein [bacterium]|nr:NPCBM/NEW2 domain-containing protein [bacterium]
MKVSGSLEAGQQLLAEYAPVNVGGATLQVRLHLTWSPREMLLRKWADYRLRSVPAGCILHEIRLESLAPVAAQPIGFIPQAPQSHPGFFKGFYAGVEYPVATTRLEGDRLVLAHRPGLAMSGDSGWLTSRKVIFGLAPVGNERKSFAAYIARHRPEPRAMHFNYNTWWTSPIHYSEKDILGLMKVFEENLYRPYGVSFQTFTIDLGWSNPKTLWDINRQLFPRGFVGIRAGAEAMQSRLGLWISPTSCYPPALDNEWAESQGYETGVFPGMGGSTIRLACLGGAKYADAFKDRITQMAIQYGIRHFKFDGYRLTCPETGHGHQPGEDSAEACAEGGIAAIAALRAAAPDTWIETTCFGGNPSPWWLFHVNSVIGSYGDDSPPSRVPAPVWRECATTGRDFYNLQGAALSPLPDTAQEVLGVIHQTDHPLLNDAVTVILRGHAFMPMYVNPKHMNARRWGQLAGLMKWARANEQILAETEPILPLSWRGGKVPHYTGNAEMPREPYGYGHWLGERGVVMLRNPWVGKQTVRLDLAKDVNVRADLANLSAVSLYPEPRLYGNNLNAQSVLEVRLAPYETLVLSLAVGQKLEGLKTAGEAVGGVLKLEGVKSQLRRIEFKAGKPDGPDWTSPMGGASEIVEMNLGGLVRSNAPESELLVLVEGRTSPIVRKSKLEINGREVPLVEIASDAQWVATLIKPFPEAWTFLTGKLNRGSNKVRLNVMCDGGMSTTCVSCWVWARKPGRPGAPRYPNGLPSPEQIYLDSAPLIESRKIAEIERVETRERPVARIDGIYLDALKPVSVSQGWGVLQRNQSVWEKPMAICGRQFRRGLGTHSPARIVYNIEGQGYMRFQSWVGADAHNPAGTITFTINIDGAKRWESGRMTTQDAPRRVDIDIRGAKMLELLVGDAGDGISGDHADFADAMLLRSVSGVK